MIGNGWVYCSTPAGNEMLVPCIIAINEVGRTMETGKLFKHKRRDEIATVYEEINTFMVAVGDSGPQIGNLVVRIGYNGYFGHELTLKIMIEFIRIV